MALEWRDRGKDREKGTDAEDVGGMMRMMIMMMMMVAALLIAYSLSKRGYKAFTDKLSVIKHTHIHTDTFIKAILINLKENCDRCSSK